MSTYTSDTPDDRAAMLAAIGAKSIDDLFADIPAGVRLDRDLNLPTGKAEFEVFDHLSELADKNIHSDREISFLGAGMYDHYVPALVDSIITRSEFLTPYTPYQPEVSQGGLQVMFEYQTAIAELTGLDVSNASVYEGPSAMAAAGYLAQLENGRDKFVVSQAVNPQYRETLKTNAHGYGTEVVEVPATDGLTDPAALAEVIDADTAAVFIQNPNFFGAIEDVQALVDAAKAHDALVVCVADPLTLGVLAPPGDFGVDICVGEGQTLGNRLDFGGPSFGFFAAAKKLIRRMPGRIAGETTDVDGRRGWVLTLQTREQHIRREKATSNICTSQALNALAGVIYLSWLGRQGIVELGELMLKRTAYAREVLGAVDGVEILFDAPVFREFAIKLDAPVRGVLDQLALDGINGGYPIGLDYPEYENTILVAITEKRSKEQIDLFAKSLASAVAASKTGVGAEA
ncbi:MAG: aminomethyl-transferring glycine dehydrogenase subunit GcvPA [Solirubrobacterales bacterium]|nr:aminomethyl-transferring glycine dehydrogenase subunit GcvPA [Solirubrobacterales bacterium]